MAQNPPDPLVPVDPALWPVLRPYALQLGKWGLYVVATAAAFGLVSWLSARLGVTIPPPPPPPAVAQVPPPGGQAEAADPLYFCGRTEQVGDGQPFKPWPTKTITWNIDPSGYSGVLTPEQVREAFDVAWRAWAKDIDIAPTYVADSSQALVRSKFAPIDGPSKVLAWSELSDGTKTPKSQQYDSAEAWTISSSPGQAQIDMVRVACHEIGHALGLVHDAEGAGALMEPIYSRTIQFPTQRDADRLVAFGYARRTAAGPKPPTIQLSVSADPERLAEALRKNGYKVELIGR